MESVTAHRTHKIKRLPIWLNVFVQTLLLIVIFLLSNYLSCRHYKTWDLTLNKQFTLSPTTTKFLSHLETPIKIIFLYSSFSPHYADVEKLIENYEQQSRGKISTSYVDLALDKTAQEIVNQYNLSIKGPTIIVEVGKNPGEKFLSIEEETMFLREGPFNQGRILSFRGEDVLTSALIKVVNEKPKKLYVLTGKGNLQQTEGGLSVLRQFVKEQNVIIENLSLLEKEKIPEDTDGLLILGAEYDFSENEIKRIQNYWESPRGALLILLDPSTKTPILDQFLSYYGIEPQNDRVLRTGHQQVSNRLTVYLTVISKFIYDNTRGIPITEKLEGTRTQLLGQSKSLKLLEKDTAFDRGHTKVYPLIESIEGYWGETNYEGGSREYTIGEDNAPPLYLAAAVEKGATNDPRMLTQNSRMVVIGNKDLLNPEQLLRQNLDFALNSINWIIDREELIGIAPKKISQFKLNIREEDYQFLLRITLFVLPLSVFILGFFIWRTRKI